MLELLHIFSLCGFVVDIFLVTFQLAYYLCTCIFSFVAHHNMFLFMVLCLLMLEPIHGSMEKAPATFFVSANFHYYRVLLFAQCKHPYISHPVRTVYLFLNWFRCLLFFVWKKWMRARAMERQGICVPPDFLFVGWLVDRWRMNTGFVCHEKNHLEMMRVRDTSNWGLHGTFMKNVNHKIHTSFVSVPLPKQKHGYETWHPSDLLEIYDAARWQIVPGSLLLLMLTKAG